ncbi:MAG: J domain-containing protein, partial [Aeromicrobium sp.]|nr:J domain-containing protein [Burkholderiales bacterium]
MSEALHTHYSNLSVAEDAPVEVITASLNALTAKYSEESYPGDAEATRIRRVLLASYYVLVSPVERRKHDEWIQARRNASLTATIDPALSPPV